MLRLLLILLIVTSATGLFAQSEEYPTVSTPDKELILSKLTKLSAYKASSMGTLVLEAGKTFLGTPYVGKTLDQQTDEKLVVNLRELDCTTFIENALALALTVKSGTNTVEQFCRMLTNIRYRDGKIQGYTSRLHYFSDWILNNGEKGITEDVTGKVGGINYPINLSFMSTHIDAYPQLKANPALIADIQKREKALSSSSFYYIPKDQIDLLESRITDGDLVALTTSIKGMEISHVGILLKKEGHIHLLHASSLSKKVEITTFPLSEYIRNARSTTGIMVIRPK